MVIPPNDIIPLYRFLQSHLIWFFLVLTKYHIHKNNKSTFAKTEIITDCQNRYEKVHIHNGYNCIPFIRTFTLTKVRIFSITHLLNMGGIKLFGH